VNQSRPSGKQARSDHAQDRVVWPPQPPSGSGTRCLGAVPRLEGPHQLGRREGSSRRFTMAVAFRALAGGSVLMPRTTGARSTAAGSAQRRWLMQPASRTRLVCCSRPAVARFAAAAAEPGPMAQQVRPNHVRWRPPSAAHQRRAVGDAAAGGESQRHRPSTGRSNAADGRQDRQQS